MNSNSLSHRNEFVPGQVIVRLKSDIRTAHATEGFAEKYGAAVADSFEFNKEGPGTLSSSPILQLTLPQGLSTEQALAKMKQDPTVDFVEPNFVYHIDTVAQNPQPTPPSQPPAQPGQPNDLVPELWGMHNTGQNGGKVDADIDAPEAWAIHTGRKDAPVLAIIDTGIDYNHPDLAANTWTNPGEIPGDGIDNDGNGVIDDVHGYNAFADTGDPLDGHGHGSHCFGTIAGVGNNGLGVVGVNHNANVMGIKIFSDEGASDSAAILRGIRYANTMGVKITSNSWGGGGASQAQKEAFASSSALHIMAAGNNALNNDLIPNYPSNYDIPNNIAVAASDRNDKKAGFSCYGKTTVDIAAPGVDIYSAAPGGGYQLMSGTSMATPHVAGVAGLVASAFPDATAEEIKAKILGGADKLDNWKTKVVDGNRLNAHGALTFQG